MTAWELLGVQHIDGPLHVKHWGGVRTPATPVALTPMVLKFHGRETGASGGSGLGQAQTSGTKTAKKRQYAWRGQWPLNRGFATVWFIECLPRIEQKQWHNRRGRKENHIKGDWAKNFSLQIETSACWRRRCRFTVRPRTARLNVPC